MQWYHFALLGAALAVALISYRTPRAVLWVSLLVASGVVSWGYLRGYEALEAGNVLGAYMADSSGFVPLEVEWLPPSIVAFGCDAAVWAVIMAFGRERWETFWLSSLVIAMAALNFIYSSGAILGFPPIPDRDTFGALLEIVNYAALALIGGTGILDRVGYGNGDSRGVLHRIAGNVRAYLRAPAKHSFWPER